MIRILKREFEYLMVLSSNAPNGLVMLKPALNRLLRNGEVWMDTIGSGDLWVIEKHSGGLHFIGYGTNNKIYHFDMSCDQKIIDWVFDHNFKSEDEVEKYYGIGKGKTQSPLSA